MNLSIDRFDEFFQSLWGYDPFPWQSRLAKQVFTDGWPDCIDLPTASGKTAAIDIAVFVLACQADRKTKDRTEGRRIFFAVNRRVIVDEAYERAYKLADRLIKAEHGILKEVADALREISGDKSAPPLDVAELRGGIYRDRAWARSITQPIVVCTTSDQLGSRLLFRGYGVSASSAPIHAALCGCDSLVLLDEAHVTRAFSQTLQLLTRYQQQHKTAPEMRFVQMTATPTGKVEQRLALDDADRSHPILKARLEASKPSELVLVGKKAITDEIVKRAEAAGKGQPKAIGIIVNRVQTARDIHTKLNEKYGEAVHLVIGRMRPIDRDTLQKQLRNLVGPERPELFPADNKPVFVVATQCLEVGADYDFDVLLTECASIDALRQRFGRLNRKGRKHPDGTPVEVTAAIVTNDAALKDEDPIYGNAIINTWAWLCSKKDEKNQVDFGIAWFKPLWDEVENEREAYLEEQSPKLLLSPLQNAAILLPAHLDALCQTNPQPVPSPDVSYFIHGPQRDNAEVNVCWRADLVGDTSQWADIVRLLPPTSPECMTVPLVAVKRWMGERYKTVVDADVPVKTTEPEQERESDEKKSRETIVIWRFGHKPGARAETKRRLVGFITNDPRDLKPGDSVIMPVSSVSWLKLGHIPGAAVTNLERKGNETKEDFDARCEELRASLNRVVDVAEQATRESKLRVIVRIHPAFEKHEPLRGLSDPDLRDKLFEWDFIPSEWNEKRVAKIERHDYSVSNDDSPDAKPDQVIIFKRLLDPPKKLNLPSLPLSAIDEDDGEDDLSESNKFISLADHTKHVMDQLASSLAQLHLNGLEPSVRASAPLHDLGKADVRFQAMLAGISPYEAMERKNLLGKGDGVRRTKAEQKAILDRALYPEGFRHEMLSVELIEYLNLEADLSHREMLLHLIAAHHGFARPFAPVCFDDTKEDELLSLRVCEEAELRTLRVNEIDISGRVRSDCKNWIPSHRLDSGIAERFWKLTREHGWWGLAWLEAILRLADQQASAAEQEGKNNE